MNFIMVLLIVALITLIGYSIIACFNLLDKSSKISLISASWGLGVGLVSFQLFVYSRLGIPWTKESILFLWAPFVLVLFIKKIPNHKLKFAFKASTKEKAFLLFVFLSILYTFFQAILRPLTAWDSWASWLFEAKVFFIEGRVVPQLFNEFSSDYPLIFKLLGSFVYIFLGQVDDTAVLLISFAFYIFSGIGLFTYIGQRHGQKLGLLFIFLLLTNQVMVRQGGRLEAGLADLPLAFFEMMATMFILTYFAKKKIKLAILASIFLGISCLVKYDGIPFAGVAFLFLIFFMIRNKLYSHLWTLLLMVLPVLDWFLFKHLNNFDTTYLSGHHFEVSVGKTINAISGTLGELVNIKSWGLAWILFGLSFFVFKKGKDEVFLICLITVQLMSYLVLYLFTFGNAPDSSIQRLLAHLFPLLLIYFSLKGKEISQRLSKIF